jgi:nicotinate-nucleotide adenylyltransferase
LPGTEHDGLGGRAERIGLLGGTFDPPHAGHLAAGASCQGALSLDRLLFVVANDPWQKGPLRAVTAAEDRFAMVQAAITSLVGAEASRMEIERGGPSYTIDTVEELLAEAGRAGRPPPEVFLIIGADLVEGLSTWERAEELQGLVTLAIVSRPRSPTPVVPEGWASVVVEAVPIDVSSSEVRELLAQGGSVEGLVPDPVIRCIRRRNRYAVPRGSPRAPTPPSSP